MGSRSGTCAGYLANPFLKQAIDMTSHSVGLAGGAKDQDRHALNGTRHASKGVLGEPTMVKGSCATLGWAACIKNARAPAMINHCSLCKRQVNASYMCSSRIDC